MQLQVEACAHGPEAVLHELDRFCAYTTPIWPLGFDDLRGHPSVASVSVLASHKAEDLQIFSIAVPRSPLFIVTLLLVKLQAWNGVFGFV